MAIDIPETIKTGLNRVFLTAWQPLAERNAVGGSIALRHGVAANTEVSDTL
jgi:hypothetical protein